MELKIIEKKENKLLGRKEIIAEVQEKTIPSKQQLREKLAALIDAKPEAIAVTKVDTKFGSPNAVVFARAYGSAEELKKKEAKYVRERNFGKEKKAEAAAGPEAPPAKLKK